MPTHKIRPMEPSTTGSRFPMRIPAGTARRAMAVAAALVALAGGARPASAQAGLGAPFTGAHYLTFYTTELSSDGVGADRSTLFGGRYGRRFGAAAKQAHFSLGLQVAARALNADDGVLDVSVNAAWTRRMDEVNQALSVTAAVGASALAWGSEDPSTGRSNVSVPATLGVAYDLHIGGAVFTPFVAPSVAYYRTRQYLDDVRVAGEHGWGTRYTSGASLRVRDLVLSTSTIRGEDGLTEKTRWTFAAGVSF